MRSILLSAAVALALTASADAAGLLPVPIESGSGLVIKVAEGCGPGYWRGPWGRCYPLAVRRTCPPGYHFGPQGRKCWPN